MQSKGGLLLLLLVRIWSRGRQSFGLPEGAQGSEKMGAESGCGEVPSGSVAVEGIRLCGREEAVLWRSCSCRHSEAPRSDRRARGGRPSEARGKGRCR